MGKVFERYCWAPILDVFMRQEPVTKQREKVVPLASGHVLELGIGSGMNLPFYRAAQVQRVSAIEPSGVLLERARERIERTGIDVELMVGSAEDLPFPDQSFDTVVTTFTLCSIPDVERALQEARRVLKPTGKLLFAEHGLDVDEATARWQRRLNSLWIKFSGGCNLDRPIATLIENAGLRLDTLETMYLPGIKLLSFNYWGTARRA